MTGYGKANLDADGVGIECEIKSWNHKGFDALLRIPENYARLEMSLRDRLARHAGRGKVSCHLRLRGASNGRKVLLNETLVAELLASFRALATRHDLPSDVSLGDLLAVPGMIEIADQEDDATERRLLETVETAIRTWDESRRTEGTRLREALLDAAEALKKTVTAIEERRRPAVAEQMERLRGRVRELAAEIPLDEKRLELEIALLGEKADVKEEMIRIAAHLESLDRLLSANDAPVGTELGFLLQELLRETNTIGSKTQDTAITRSVIAAKTSIDRLKEISANAV
jgi:uncharacterized protein (TIGR00255 family)